MTLLARSASRPWSASSPSSTPSSGGSGLGTGFGIGVAVMIFIAGGTIACGARMPRRGDEPRLLALASDRGAGLAIDLLRRSPIWLEIDDETYGKIAAIAFVWTLLRLARARAHARGAAASRAARASALRRRHDRVSRRRTHRLVAHRNGGGGPVGLASPVGLVRRHHRRRACCACSRASLVLLAALWFAALAASRLVANRSRPERQTLKRTLRTSPSSTT